MNAARQTDDLAIAEATKLLENELAGLRACYLPPAEFDRAAEGALYKWRLVLMGGQDFELGPRDRKNAVDLFTTVKETVTHMRLEFVDYIRSTQKAYQFELLNGRYHWFPKSVVSKIVAEENILLVARWFVAKNPDLLKD